MKHIQAVVLATLLVSCGSTFAGETPPGNVFYTAATVDAQGRVTQMQAEDGTAPAITAVLKQAIPQWRFEPATVNGTTVPVQTYIGAKVEVKPSPGGYMVRVSFAGVGPRCRFPTAFLRYPPDALAKGRQGDVLVLFHVTAGGAVTITRSLSSMDGSSGADRESLPLKRSTRDWVAKGTCKPERIAGKPLAANDAYFISFRLHEVDQRQIVPELSEPEGKRSQAKLIKKGGLATDPARPQPSSVGSVLKPLHVDTVIMKP